MDTWADFDNVPNDINCDLYIASTDDISFDNMKRAIINGSALASFCVEEFGTERLKKIKNKDLEERIEEFVALTNFDMEQVIS